MQMRPHLGGRGGGGSEGACGGARSGCGGAHEAGAAAQLQQVHLVRLLRRLARVDHLRRLLLALLRLAVLPLARQQHHQAAHDGHRLEQELQVALLLVDERVEARPHEEREAAGLRSDLGDDEEDADALRHDEHRGEDRSDRQPEPHALHGQDLAGVVKRHANRVVREGPDDEEARRHLQPPVHALDVDVPVDPRVQVLERAHHAPADTAVAGRAPSWQVWQRQFIEK